MCGEGHPHGSIQSIRKRSAAVFLPVTQGAGRDSTALARNRPFCAWPRCPERCALPVTRQARRAAGSTPPPREGPQDAGHTAEASERPAVPTFPSRSGTPPADQWKAVTSFKWADLARATRSSLCSEPSHPEVAGWPNCPLSPRLSERGPGAFPVRISCRDPGCRSSAQFSTLVLSAL